MEKILLKPKVGLKVRKPNSMMLLREEGEKLPMTAYWARRLKDGDVLEVKEVRNEEPKAVVKKSSSKKKKHENIEWDRDWETSWSLVF